MGSNSFVGIRVFHCDDCNKHFMMPENVEPTVCAACCSPNWEWSHDATMINNFKAISLCDQLFDREKKITSIL